MTPSDSELPPSASEQPSPSNASPTDSEPAPGLEAAPLVPPGAQPVDGSSFIRKALNVVGSLVALALACGVLVAYYANTSQLEFVESLPTLTAEAGKEFILELPDEVACLPQFTTVYRSAPLGRWQQTHTSEGSGFTADRREMWHTDEKPGGVTDECVEPTPLAFVIPAEGFSDEVAICEVEQRCIRIAVE